MGCIKVDYLLKGPERFFFNPTMAVYERIYYYLGDMIPPSILQPSLLLVYIHDTSYVTQSNARTAQIHHLNSG